MRPDESGGRPAVERHLGAAGVVGRSAVGSPIAKAMVVIRRPADGAILVSGDVDEDGTGYERPLGGHIELGELAEETIRREILEEIGEELRSVRLLDVIENLFTLNGAQGHEIVFVFEAEFVDDAPYQVEQRTILDHPTGRVRVRWRLPGEINPRLVPDGIERVVQDSG